MRKQFYELILTVVFLTAAIAIFLYGSLAPRPTAVQDHACCHAKIYEGAALAAGQDNLIPVASAAAAKPQAPGQDGEDGNPSHTRPDQACNSRPVGKQVLCHCVTDCGGDGTPREDRKCKSYCFKDMCSCPRRPCP